MISNKWQTAKRFLRHRLAIIGLIWLLILLFASIATPIIERYPMEKIDLGNRYSPPSPDHWLGTDALGRDVWSRTIHGARVSLEVAAITVSGSVIIGIIIGAFSAMLGNIADILLQRFTEIIMSIPLLVIALVFMAILEPGLWPLMAVLATFGWTDTTRIVRGELLSIREEEYIEATYALGFGWPRIVFKHALPGCLPSLLVNATLKAATFILVEAALSFLGFGVQPPTPSWGLMLAEAQEMEILTQMPWLWIPPGLAITFTVLAFNFVGDGLRDALTPRERYTVI